MAHSNAISHRFTTVIVIRMVIDWLMANPSPLDCCFYYKVSK